MTATAIPAFNSLLDLRGSALDIFGTGRYYSALASPLISNFPRVRPSGLLRRVSAGTIYNWDQSGAVLRWAIIEDKA